MAKRHDRPAEKSADKDDKVDKEFWSGESTAQTCPAVYFLLAYTSSTNIIQAMVARTGTRKALQQHLEIM